MSAARAQAQGTISTVAGGSGYLDNIPAKLARLDGPQALAVDAQGNAYIGDGPRIRRIDAATGTLSTVAGNGFTYPLTDGSALEVALSGPANLLLDPAGNLVFTDGGRVMKLDLQHSVVKTIANSSAQFSFNAGLAEDRGGNLYATDYYNGKIYRIDANTSALTTVAGTGPVPNTSGDNGPATAAGLQRPSSITVDPAGNIFFAELYWLRRIDGRTGIITSVMPIMIHFPRGDGGPVAAAALDLPSALATDGAGNLYIADGNRIRKINWTAMTIATIAGSGQSQYQGDGGPGLLANISAISQMVVDAAGNLWMADSGDGRVLLLRAATGLIETVAGLGHTGDGGPALGALLGYVIGLATAPSGDLYIATPNSVRRVDASSGVIYPVASLALSSHSQQPLAVDSFGNVFVAGEDRVTRIDAGSGAATVVAGGNGIGFSGDGGPSTAAQMSPSSIALDPAGNLYIADYWAFRVRRVDVSTRQITTVAGNGGGASSGYDGTNGPASQIALGPPGPLAVSASSGDLYISLGTRIARLDSSGALSIAVGTGMPFYAGDGGLATAASLCTPTGLQFDTQGNLFVLDSACASVRRIEAGTGIIQTVAGTGVSGVGPDGVPATQVKLVPRGVAVFGNMLYVNDSGNAMANASIRAVTPDTPPPLPQPPNVTAVVNSANFTNALSPGALVSVLGNYLGPATPLTAQPGADGRFATQLGGESVTFAGQPAPLLSISAGRIDGVVPYRAPVGFTLVNLTTADGTGASFTGLSRTSLAVIPNLVINPDGSRNSPANTAPTGAVLTLYGTGLGPLTPAPADGQILNGPTLPVPVTQAAATIGSPAVVQYIGPVPGAVAGAMQVNVRVPDSALPGKSTLVVTDSYGSAFAQDVYILTAAPALTSLNPASPIPQTLGHSVNLTLVGSHLDRITAINFYLNGDSVNVQNSIVPFSCAGTTCNLAVYFAGQAGQYSVQVVNEANQVSNRLAFTVQPLGPATIAGVFTILDSTAIVGSNDRQLLRMTGSNFRQPLTAELFYDGSQVASVDSSTASIFNVNSADFNIWFNFQGRPGQYGIDVVTPDGLRSERFLFNVSAAP